MSFMPSFPNLQHLRADPRAAKIEEISTLPEQTTTSTFCESNDQGHLNHLYLKVLSMTPERLVLDNSVFQGSSSAHFIVVFLSVVPHQEIDVCFLDFDTKRWLGIQRMSGGFSHLRDLLPYMLGFKSKTRFLLFGELLQNRTEEIPSLKAAMDKENLAWVDFSKDLASGLILPKGSSTICTESRSFPRLMANREISGRLLKRDKKDFDVKVMRKMGERIIRIRNSLRNIKNLDRRHLMAMGLGNYFNSLSFGGFARFLGSVRKLVKRQSRRKRH